jgi:hypothetical protein
MGRRLAVLAGPHRQALIALLAMSAPVLAAPKSRAAKVQFDKGVAAYKKSDFVSASLAFDRSLALEVDLETLFAYAQAERKQGHCAKASELYVKLLAMKMPAENKTVVKDQLDQCKRILADDKAQADAVKVEAARAEQARAEAARAEPAPPVVAPPEAPEPAAPVHLIETHAEPTPVAVTHPWYTDPAGDTLVVLGLAGLAAGAALFVSAHSAEAQSKTALDYDHFQALDDKAAARGLYGVIATSAGAALVIGGVIRYATRSSTTTESTVLTGWASPTGGGLALTGGF